ncbi:VOC family protein [Catelliglobosispora koreensis]|uniref:VOC family protein n=1 Tax=Catelliglobosispora koreensis TaxID=129052 RepID=UPI00036BF388|nr:VOC family protein [Catelliglobosispora koreensis]
MRFAVRNIAFDCTDPYALATFWSQLLGVPMSQDDQPGDPVATISPPGTPTLYFAAVPEPKTVKNRVHVCLTPEIARDTEVERLLGLGATIVTDQRQPDGTGWVVFADPEGNEFCVLRSEAERAATGG